MTISGEQKRKPAVWEEKFQVKPDQLEFRYHFYDLFSGEEKHLLERLRGILEKLKRPDLSGPLYLIMRELLTNSLKTMYKRLYMEYFIIEMGLTDLSYEDWLGIFKTEIETHMADNFARICREKNVYVEAHMMAQEDHLLIEIVNDGIPSEIEWGRLQRSMNRANEIEDLSYLFHEETTADNYQEGAGIGMPLISIILKNISADMDDVQVTIEDNKTIARFKLPVKIFLPA